MVVLPICSDSLDYGGGPFDNKVLQAVALVEVRVHVLLEGLPGLPAFLATGVELGLLGVDVRDELPQLP